MVSQLRLRGFGLFQRELSERERTDQPCVVAEL